MAEKSGTRKKSARKRSKDEAKPAPAPWPDPKTREQMSRNEAERDAGKHSKNLDWQKKW